MVYTYSRVGTRTLIKTAVLCVLSISVIPSVRADASSSTAADVCGVSDGDKSVGIRAVDDATCASGGLGCYNGHCRFCKILETPQSSAFENCTTFGAEFPTMAPLIPSSGTCEVSSGDAAVGIAAFTDTGCMYGGLGCFNDHCRFCKVASTAQSEAFVDCPGNSTAGSTTDAPVDTATSASSTTSSSSSTTDTDGCTLVPAEGDVEVGISIGTDATCSAGGLGCINDVCRFCRIRTTTKSASYTDCSLLGTSAANAAPDVPAESPAATADTPTATTETPAATAETPADSTDVPAATTATPVTSTDAPASTTAAPAADTTCAITASVGDAAVGISIVTDATCVSGGVGCITDVCRFCKVTTSTQSAAFLDCSQFASNASTSDVPVADNSHLSADDSDTSDASDATTDTPAVTTNVTVPIEVPTAVPDATTEPPAAVPAVPEAPTGETCTQTVSAGDASVGINIFTDTSCSAGGTGCIDSVCRFCKVTETTQSAAFVDCPSIAGTATTTEAPAATDAATEAPTEAPADASTEAPTDAGTEAPTDAPTDAPTQAPTGETCTQTVSAGDASVGINIFTDTSCSAGGTGCIDSVCRFCKVTETTQSAAFVDCPSIAGTATTTEAPAATDAATEAPTEAPADASTEAPTDAGTEAPTDAPTDAPTQAPTGETCTQTVSAGDASVGINIFTDTSCSAGGTGCIDSVCRFCKVTETTQSAAFVDCPSIAGTATTTEAPAATDAATEAPTEAPADASTEAPTDAGTEAPTDAPTDAPTQAPTGETCTQTVSEGDAAVGINIVTDTSCSAGGVGCIDNVCRFCKVTETSQSSTYNECSSITGTTSVNALTANAQAETSTQSIADEATADILSGEQIGAAVAGCVGAIAAVAVVARAAKRSSASSANPNEPSDDDDEVDNTETGKRVSPGPVPTEEPVTAEA